MKLFALIVLLLGKYKKSTTTFLVTFLKFIRIAWFRVKLTLLQFFFKVVKNTQQEKWVKNCRTDGICPGGNKGGGTTCDTSDYKRLSSDYCGKCKFGYRRPWMNLNDWCCTVRDRWNGDCKCLARVIPECVGPRGEKLNCCCYIRLNSAKGNFIS